MVAKESMQPHSCMHTYGLLCTVVIVYDLIYYHLLVAIMIKLLRTCFGVAAVVVLFVTVSLRIEPRLVKFM